VKGHIFIQFVILDP